MLPNTAKQRRIETFEEDTKKMGDLYNQIEALREQEEKIARQMQEVEDSRNRITELHLRDSSVDLQEREREIVVEDLINYCLFEARQKQRWGSALSPGLLSKLKECYRYNIDPEFVTGILFIFGMIGSHIDLNNIKNLDYKKPEDEAVIEELMGILSDEMDFAINTCRKKMPTNIINRTLLTERLNIARRAVDDFENPKREYLEHEQFLKDLEKEESRRQREADGVDEEAEYWFKTTVPATEKKIDERLAPEALAIPEAATSEDEKQKITKELVRDEIEASLDLMKLSPRERVEILKQLLSEAKKNAKSKKNIA